MKAKHDSVKSARGGNAKSGKTNTPKPKPGRAKRVRSLVPKQFLDIIERINDGLVVLDKDWRYVYLNQKAAVMLQRQSPVDLIGKHIWTEYPEGLGQPFQLAYEQAMRDQTPIVFEDHYEPWDLWFENRLYPSPDRLLILFTEITDRKRIEGLLNERQYFLQKILDTEPGTVYIYDLVEKRNIYINRYWLHAYGYTEEETQAMGDQLLLSIIHPDDLERVMAHHTSWRQADEGDIREIEYRIRTKTGEWCWLHSHEAGFVRDETGSVKQILGISYEVTARKLAQEALRHSEQQLELIYDSVSDIIFLLSVEPENRYRFISINKAFLQATGLRSDQVMGKYADEIIPAASHALVFGNYRKAIQERIPVTWEEVSDYPSGKKIAIVTVNAVYSEADHCSHLVGTIHDITDRKLAEEEIRLSELRYRTVIENQTEFIVRWKPDGTRTFANEAYRRYFGLTPEEVLSASFIALIADEDRSAVEAKLVRLVSGAVPAETDIHRVIKADGSIGWQEWVDQAIYDETGRILEFQSVGRDITERRQMEKAVLEERDFSDAMLNSLPGVFYFYDQAGRFLRWNRNFEIITGYSAQEIAQMNPLDFFVGAEKDYIGQRIQEVFQTGESDAEANIFTKSGEPIPYYFTGKRVEIENVPYLIGMGIDISERKRAEQALAASETELRALFAAMNDVVLVIDSNGVYQKIAPTNPKLLSRPPQELLGKTLRDVFPEDQAETFMNTIQLVIETQEIARIEYQLNIDRRALWFEASISPMEADKILWMARDITDRKQAEERLQRLNEELEQRVAARTEELAAAMIRAQESDRLKSAFLAAMSHELRTPLNSIIGFTGVILQGLAGPLNEEQTKQLNMTRDSARHLLALINDVLDISKIEAGQLEILKRPFDMRQAIESALRIVHPLAQKKNLQVVTSIGSGVGILNNDRRRVEQVLINLINNAIKFSEHGDVRIECQIRENWLETSVRDQGIGIKPEDMDRLFKPFQQIDTGLARSHEGTGLGLAICQRLVSAMGGEITVESQWGLGSLFRFTLPL